MARQLTPLALVASLFAGCQVDQQNNILPEEAFVPSVETKETIADVAPPPPYELTLELDNLAVDDFVKMSVTGAAPGENVIFLRGTGEGETCPPGFDPLCVDLSGADLAFRGSSQIADADGEATMYFGLPANPDLVGQRVYMQAIVYTPEVKYSNVVVSEVSAGLPCTDDLFEPNDSFEASRTIPSGSWENLSLCGDLEDWYLLDANEGDILNFGLAFLDDEGDIDLQVYDGSGYLVAGSYSVGDSEEVEVIAAADAPVYVRVYMYRDEGIEQQGNVYDMTIERTPSELFFCEPDRFEDNDTPADAFDLSAVGLISGGGVTDVFDELTSCEGDGPSDYDTYSVDLAAGETIAVYLEFLDAEGDIDVSLLNLGGATLDSSAGIDDDEYVSFTAAEDQTVIIRVQLYSDDGIELIGGNDYTMSVTVGTGAMFDARLLGIDFGPHEGQTVTAALVDLATGEPVAGDSQVVVDGAIDLPFPDVMDPEGSYEWHVWADVTGEGVCDAPPTDHVWLIDAGQAFTNIVTEYVHDVEFTDVCATF